MSAFTPTPYSMSDERVAEALGDTMRRVFLLMTLGLLATTAAAFGVAVTPLSNLILGNMFIFFGLIVGELVLVIVLSAAIGRLAPATALALFLVYAVVNGLTLSVIFFAYSSSAIAVAFFATACMFGAMALLGYTTQMDFSKFGVFLLMGLVGLIVVSLVNFFLRSDLVSWIISLVGAFLFLGLTAYDTQKIKRMLVPQLAAGDEAAVSRVSVLGALSLYLDFINLFLMILRLISRKR